MAIFEITSSAENHEFLVFFACIQSQHLCARVAFFPKDSYSTRIDPLFQIDRMAADCALELQSHNVTFIGLAPGFVNTEMETIGQHNVTNGNPTGETAKLGANAFVLDSRYRRGESIEFSGKCIVALAQGMILLFFLP